MVQPQQTAQMSDVHRAPAAAPVHAAAAVAAVGTAVAPPHQRCRVPGCSHTRPQPQFPAQCTTHVRQAIWKAEASKWSQHWRQQHRNRRGQLLEQHRTPQQFLDDHSTTQWRVALQVCSACDDLVSRHNLAGHNSRNKHIQAVAEQAEAERQHLLDAEMLPPGAPRQQPRVNTSTNDDDADDHPAGPSYEWSLQPGTPQREAIDSLDPDHILRRQWRTIASQKGPWIKPFAVALEYVLRGVRTSHAAAKQARSEGTAVDADAVAIDECAAWCTLLQLLPALLLSPDGSVTRSKRFMHFAMGSWPSIIAGLIRFTDKMAAKSRSDSSTHSTCRLSDTARRLRQPGGIGRTAQAILNGPNSSSPRTAATLAALQLKHPAGPMAEALAAAAEAGSEIATAKLTAIATNHTTTVTAAAAVPFTDMFTAKSIRSTIVQTVQGVAPGLSGLRNSHLQMMIKHADTQITRRNLSHLAWMGRTVFTEPDSLPDVFWQFFRAARLSAVGEKARPIACGDTLRRLFTRIYTAANATRFSALFQPVGQFGVGVPCGVDKVGLTAQLIHEAGGTLIAIDGRNAFNAVSRTEVLRQAAEHIPEAYALVRKLYGSAAQPDLLFGMDGQALAAVMTSAEGVQQGDPLGPTLFSLVVLPIMQEFLRRFPEFGMPGFLDDLTICILTGGPLLPELQAVRVAYDWLVLELAAVGIKVNTDKTVTLLPADAATRVPEEHKHRPHAFASEVLGGVKVTSDPGLTIVGSPLGTQSHVEQAVAATLQDPAADTLLRSVAGMRDTQGAMTLLRMCYVSRATFLSRNARPEATELPLRRFDATVRVALASIMQEPLATTATGFDDNGTCDDFSACFDSIRSDAWSLDREAPVSGTAFTKAQQLLVHLPPRHGGFGLASQHTRRHSCYVARTVANMQSVLLTLPDAMRAKLRPVLLQLPTFTSLRSSVKALQEENELTVEVLTNLLPPELVSWVNAHDEEELASSAERVLQWAFSESAIPDSDIPTKLQSVICRAADVKTAEKYKASLGTIVWPLGPTDGAEYAARLQVLQRHARYNGKSSKGAAAFLTALPSVSPHLSMEDADYREALRRWLSIEMPDPGGLCPKCDVELTAEHARRCANTGEQNTRHHAIRDLVYDTLQSCTRLVLVRKEDAGPFIDRGYTRLIMDVTWAPGCMLLGHLGARDARALPLTAQTSKPGGLLDTCIVDETGLEQVKRGVRDMTGPAYKAGAAAMTKVKQKHDTYGGKHPSNYTLISFILEQSGACCPDVHEFIKAAALHEFHLSDGAWPVSATVQRWRQKISMTLQKVLSITTRRVFSRVRAVVGRPEPEANRYESVCLVLRPSLADEELLPAQSLAGIARDLVPQLAEGQSHITGD